MATLLSNNNRILDAVRSTINTTHCIKSDAGSKVLETGQGTATATFINGLVNGTGKKFTLSFWIQRRRNGFASNERLYSNVVSGGENQIDMYFASNDQLVITWGGSTGIAETYISTTKFFQTFAWYNIVVTYDQTLSALNRTKIYVNGILDVISSAIPSGSFTSIMSSTRSLMWGFCSQIGSSTTGFFNKKSLALWNIELTSTEVFVLYGNGNPLSPVINSGNYVSAANLKLLFDCENAVWTTLFTITDSSGNNNGTMTSGTHVQADYIIGSPN